jgi:hypothetical protein
MAPMRRLACLVGFFSLAGPALWGAEAAAEPRALLDAPRAEDVAVAGGEVLVAATTARGGARLTAVPVGGGEPRSRLWVRPPGRGEWTSMTELASSAQLAALLVDFTDPEGNTTEWRVYAGPPSGPLAIVHRARFVRQRPWLWFPIEIDVHGDRLVIQEIRVALREGVRPRFAFRLSVQSPGMSPARVPQGRFGAPTVVAGDRVAYLSLRRPLLVRIVDWRSGRLAGTIGLGRYSGEILERHLDLTADGRAVVELDGDLLAGAPGERARPLPGTADAPDLSAPRFAGERVAALAEARLDSRRPVIVDPRAATLNAVGPPSSAATAIAADETTVAWLANGCVLAADVDDVAPLDMVPPGPCPRAEVVLHEHDQKLRGRILRVRVTCVAAPPPGCRGTVVLRFAGHAGEGSFRVPAGARRLVEVRLTRRGIAAVRRQFRLDGVALLRLGARVADGRVSREAGPGWVLIRSARLERERQRLLE